MNQLDVEGAGVLDAVGEHASNLSFLLMYESLNEIHMTR